MRFLGLCVTVFRIENSGLLTIFAAVLLVAVAVLAVFLQVTATATWTGVDFLFDYHRYSLIETFCLNHYPHFQLIHAILSITSTQGARKSADPHIR